MKNRVQPSVIVLLCVLGALGSGPAAWAADVSELVGHLLEMSDTTQGICSVVGCADGSLPVELGRPEGLLVHVWEPDAAVVPTARKLADEEGLHGTRVVVEKGRLDRLPYADNMVDLLIAAHLTQETLATLSPVEVMRVLRPEGKAIIGRRKDLPEVEGAVNTRDLRAWARAAEIKGASVVRDRHGVWARITKPELKGAGDWSHWEHGPDNNPVANDELIKAPYMTKYLGKPYYIAMPAITVSAGGRTFLAMGHIAHHKREEPWLNTLLARNAYNGTILWSRKLPDGYLVHRSAFIATEDTFYMIDTDGSGVLMIDAKTGNDKGRIETPRARGEWKWIAMRDRMLFALIGDKKDPAETTVVRSELTHWSWGELSQGYYGKRIPWGFAKTVVSYDTRVKRIRWTHREEAPIDSRSMAISGDNMYLYCPDAHIRCLNVKTGKETWTNNETEVRELIEEPGRGLSSTPGFRTMTFCVANPQAIVYQAQTRQNVVAISAETGAMLWTRKKTTNNPNAIFVDDNIVIGIGKNGNSLVVNPLTGSTIEDLGFAKRSCARLTATTDSFFVRGMPDGITRYDRNTKKVLYNGAVRPACNDGIIAANGLLYAGPWMCDCNLTLIGSVVMTSAGDFKFDVEATDAERLESGEGDITKVAAFDAKPEDWLTYRGNNARGSATAVAVPGEVNRLWAYASDDEYAPTAATVAGGLVFIAGDDGKVRAIEAATGKAKWTYLTAGPILKPPSIWNGRAYVGSGDGYIYALEAATGRMLWRFRAAPVERRIPVYGSLCSTWPVNSGVIVQDGVAYAAAGIIDYDGTYVYALDAVTGKLKWQNNSSGHLDKDLRKGVSVQGGLTIAGGRLWLAGGNVVSPGVYDLKTGAYVGNPPGNGSPRTNRGEEIGVFKGNYIVLGGRLIYSGAANNVVDPGTFVGHAIQPEKGHGGARQLSRGKIAPAWNDKHVALVNGRGAAPTVYDAGAVEAYLKNGKKKLDPKPLAVAKGLRGRDTVALAVAPNTVLAVCEAQHPRSFRMRTTLCSLDVTSDTTEWERTLPGQVMPGGIAVDRNGRVFVVLADGGIVCFGGPEVLDAQVNALRELAAKGDNEKKDAVRRLRQMLQSTQGPRAQELVIKTLQGLGVEYGDQAKEVGFIPGWQLLGPVPWNSDNPTDKVLIGEPSVDVTQTHTVAGSKLTWRRYVTDSSIGIVDLATIYGPLEGVAAYAYAEFDLPAAQDVVLKIGTNDGFKGWFNGAEFGRFNAGRSYSPDQDVFTVKGAAGVNKILLKVTQLGSAWACGVRLTNAAGEPIAFTQKPAVPPKPAAKPKPAPAPKPAAATKAAPKPKPAPAPKPATKPAATQKAK